MSESTDDPGSASTHETITVYSDYVCPFCYLGRESLDRYLAEREEPLRIDWHPFDLRASQRGPDGEIDDAVDDGKDDEYYEKARENVERLAEEYDVEMDPGVGLDVDSFDAQVASVHVADEYHYDKWLAFDEALFDALWQAGRDVGDLGVLADIGADVGLDPEAIRDAVADDARREAVRERFRAARQDRVTGVPTFVFDDRVARGAVPPAQLRRLVEGS